MFVGLSFLLLFYGQVVLVLMQEVLRKKSFIIWLKQRIFAGEGSTAMNGTYLPSSTQTDRQSESYEIIENMFALP